MTRHRIEELQRDRESLLAHGRDLLSRVVARSVGCPELVELDVELLEYVALYVEAVQHHLMHERDTEPPPPAEELAEVIHLFPLEDRDA
jgi:hypothetical protein